jgi:hypothetical protein
MALDKYELGWMCPGDAHSEHVMFSTATLSACIQTLLTKAMDKKLPAGTVLGIKKGKTTIWSKLLGDAIEEMAL